MDTYTGHITKLKPNQVFIFGSNLSGFHGAGAAGYASFGVAGNQWRKFNYADKPKGWKGKWNVKGVGEGFQEGTEGKSYALPTVLNAGNMQSLTKEQIQDNIKKLYKFAEENPSWEFIIAYCDDGNILLNGYTIDDMVEMFCYHDIPKNVVFEIQFKKKVTALLDEKNDTFEWGTTHL